MAVAEQNGTPSKVGRIPNLNPGELSQNEFSLAASIGSLKAQR